MLIGQFWVSTVSYYCWMIDAESELIELCDSEDTEVEKDSKKEKDAKLPIDSYAIKIDISIKTINILHSKDFRSMHHPETTTPPPEGLFFLS